MVAMKEKEKQWNEARKQLMEELEGKENKIREMKEEALSLKELFEESQAIVDHLTGDAAKYE